MLSAIIVAGGGSQRMGFDKLFAELNGRPVVAHSIAAFEGAAAVQNIILVARAELLSEYEELIRREAFGKVVAVISGGERRQDSVARGLERLPEETDYVAVHDAARPLVRPEEIETIYQSAQIHGGASGAAPVVDTLKRVDRDLVVRESVERKNLFAVQTPQIFRRELLVQACAAVAAAGVEVTDEISAVERMGGKVVLVPNDKPNFKITYPADLAMAEFVLQHRSEA